MSEAAGAAVSGLGEIEARDAAQSGQIRGSELSVRDAERIAGK